MKVLEINNLNKTYKALDFWKKDRITAVEDVSLTVSQGEIFGLLGLNGAGKTTLMKVILGLLKPTSGDVKIFGTGIDDFRTRRRIGYMPELPYFPKYLTAEEVLTYFADILDVPQKKKKKKISEVLETVGLSHKAGVKIKGFSKGMQGRLGMAQALLNDPDLLLLDEPMTGLDPLGYKDTRDIIINLKRRGRTIFFNSHILSEVEKVCDRVGVLHKSKLVSLEKVSAVKKKHKSVEAFFVQLVSKKRTTKGKRKK